MILWVSDLLAQGQALQPVYAVDNPSVKERPISEVTVSQVSLVITLKS